jgi:trimeric autotransporter adhesin
MMQFGRCSAHRRARPNQAIALGGTARITDNIKMKAGVGMSAGGTTAGIGASYQW